MQSAFLKCPHCGEQIEVIVDCSAGDQQQYVEDCSVCCCPIVITVATASGEVVAIDGRSEGA
ncbi:MAG: CPXCG motif-containing cysteine-rich protein [Xanthomonadaceae bacterium]|nr:CPXCG motif-containing cysteine-rich protein [Xanthomonadaceae bacterium]MDP2184523.1 CPXCG motif-containing cysteine-rich protein [Xanthomonadales bacterium]